MSLWDFTTWNDQSATRSFTVGASDQGTSNWSAQLYVEFYDPNASWWEAISGTVDVNHNGTHTSYTIFQIIGNGGTTNYQCLKSVNFTAVNGDTVTITITGRNSFSNSHVRFASVHAWRIG